VSGWSGIHSVGSHPSCEGGAYPNTSDCSGRDSGAKFEKQFVSDSLFRPCRIVPTHLTDLRFFGSAGRLTKFAPVLLMQLYFVFLRGGFDAFPGGVAFVVGHPLHLLEAGDCVAHVSSVMDRFFTLPWGKRSFHWRHDRGSLQ
jgi:hypothetical protein